MIRAGKFVTRWHDITAAGAAATADHTIAETLGRARNAIGVLDIERHVRAESVNVGERHVRQGLMPALRLVDRGARAHRNRGDGDAGARSGNTVGAVIPGHSRVSSRALG